MRKCFDRLETLYSVKSNDQQYCVSFPAYNSVNVPYISNNIENNDRTVINSQLLQAIQDKVDRFQTPSSNDIDLYFEHLTDIIKQHIPNFVFNQTIDYNKEQDINTPSPNQPILSRGLRSLSKILSKHTDNNVKSSRNHDNLLPLVKNAHSPSSLSATSVSSKKSINHSLRQTDNEMISINNPIISQMNLKSHTSLKPTQFQPDYPQKDTLKFSNISIKSNSPNILTNKTQDPICSYEPTQEKISSRTANLANDSNRIDLNDLHVKEALAVFETHLTKEAYRTLIKRKHENKQNRFIRLLMAPSRCCRSCRTQQRFANITEQTINIAIQGYKNMNDKT